MLQGQDECTTWGPTGDPDDCQAHITHFNLTEPATGDGWGLLDLTGVYTDTAGVGVTRGIALISAAAGGAGSGRDVVIIRDEWSAATTAVNVTWSLHTFACVAPGSSPLSLVLNATAVGSGAPISIELLADDSTCPGLLVHVDTVVLAPPQTPLPGLTRITLVAPQPSRCSALTVVMGAAVSGARARAAADREVGGGGMTSSAFSYADSAADRTAVLDGSAVLRGVRPLAEWPLVGPWGAN